MTPTLERTKKDTARMTVLLIEDDPDDRRLVEDYLTEAGPGKFSLEAADRLSTGLERLSEGGIGAVLLDLFLPDSEGFETFVQTHAHSPRVPIVILTGLDDEQLAIQAVREGAQDYLRKEDLSAETLIRALRYAAERKQAEEQLRQAQKIEAIGRLAGGTARDFNDLLEIILGNSEILEGCGLQDDIARRAVERISQTAKSAASLAAQLLAFSLGQTLGSPESGRSSVPRREARRGTETILLVDGNASLREASREFLVASGYTVLDAGSPEDAWSQARSHRGPIHMLLTDVILPSATGQEVAAQLKSLHPEIAVVYMSGDAQDVLAQHGLLDPGIALLQKPFTRSQLLSFVRETLDNQKAKRARGTG